MLRFDLGSHTFKISTRSTQAQRLFDQGLNWCFGFNQEEGVACFKKALEYDPHCAMLHWGVAYAAGPFCNMPWSDFSISEANECTALCRANLDQAVSMASNSSPMEQALVAALSLRIQQPHGVSKEAYAGWDDAYADAMRQVNSGFPDNQDVMALFLRQ